MLVLPCLILRRLVGRLFFCRLLAELYLRLLRWRRCRRLAVLVAHVGVLGTKQRLHCLDCLRRWFLCFLCRALSRRGRRRRSTRSRPLFGERAAAPTTPAAAPTTPALAATDLPVDQSWRSWPKHRRDVGHMPCATPARLCWVEPLRPIGHRIHIAGHHVFDLEALAACMLDVHDGRLPGALDPVQRAHAEVRLDHDDVVAGI